MQREEAEMKRLIQNHTFTELKIGDTASLVRTLTYEDIELLQSCQET